MNPRKYKVKEIMQKAHWGSGSHLKIDRTVEIINDLVYCKEKMQNYVKEVYFNCKIWAGRTKKLKIKNVYIHINR